MKHPATMTKEEWKKFYPVQKNYALCENCETSSCVSGYVGDWCDDYANADKHQFTRDSDTERKTQ